MAEDIPLTIGEVINLLREEFPDVSVSKVRFLESQGLLAPGRSEGGYRLFDEADIERVRYILRQQRDHFLPLKVIKSKLTLWDRGEELPAAEAPAPNRGFLDDAGEPLTRAELLRKSQLSEAQLGSLVEHGLVAPESSDPDLFPSRALTVASEARILFGHGLEGRHLRALRLAAEREADVLGQLTTALSRIRSAEARDRVASIISECGESMAAIHRVLLSDELNRLLER